MRRIKARTRDEVFAWDLADNNAPIFEESHSYRIAECRRLVRKALEHPSMPQYPVIWEIGCGSADICGPFSDQYETHGLDGTPAAFQVARARWPNLLFHQGWAEDEIPHEADVLILCEVLEHVHDPWEIVMNWMPLAQFSVIGHPAVGDDEDLEAAHVWAYDEQDFHAWFDFGGHQLIEEESFGLGPFKKMVLGLGRRR